MTTTLSCRPISPISSASYEGASSCRQGATTSAHALLTDCYVRQKVTRQTCVRHSTFAIGGTPSQRCVIACIAHPRTYPICLAIRLQVPNPNPSRYPSSRLLVLYLKQSPTSAQGGLSATGSADELQHSTVDQRTPCAAPRSAPRGHAQQFHWLELGCEHEESHAQQFHRDRRGRGTASPSAR